MFYLKIYVGTSGWMYDWNPDGFDWYLKHSGLNAVELNASFYRFPFPNQVRSWARKTKAKPIRWSIKVNRLITHVYMFNERGKEAWDKFYRLFKILDPYIDFYLFQLPPRIKPTKVMVKRLEEFIEYTRLGTRFALEWRNNEWFRREWVEWAKDLGITIVSVDSPEIIFYSRSSSYVYVRMHGRTLWYSHYYTDNELKEVAEKLLSIGGESVYVFFNNDHDMLENARRMKKLLELKITSQ